MDICFPGHVDGELFVYPRYPDCAIRDTIPDILEGVLVEFSLLMVVQRVNLNI